MPLKPFVVGVTGGIGSGKSSFCELFHRIDVPLFSADLEARSMMNDDPDVRKEVSRNFGESAYKDGMLDRKKIAEIVFNDKEQLNVINSIVLSPLWERFGKWKQHQKSPYVFIESATLIEHGGINRVDHVVVVTASREVRIQRVMSRDGMTREQVTARMNSQMDEDLRLSYAQTIIVNDGDTNSLIAQAVEFRKYIESLV